MSQTVKHIISRVQFYPCWQMFRKICSQASLSSSSWTSHPWAHFPLPIRPGVLECSLKPWALQGPKDDLPCPLSCSGLDILFQDHREWWNLWKDNSSWLSISPLVYLALASCQPLTVKTLYPVSTISRFPPRTSCLFPFPYNELSF